MPGKSGPGSRGHAGEPFLGAPSDVLDPYLPDNGNLGFRISRYDLELEYKVSSNRLEGTAVLTATSHRELRRFTLDLASSMSVQRVSVNDKRARYSHRRHKLSITPDTPVPPGGGAMTITVRYHGNPPADPWPLGGRGRLGRTDGRLTLRQPTQRRGVVVPVRRPSECQSAVPDLDHHRQPVPRTRQRRTGVQAGPRCADHLGLSAGGADADLPRVHPDRSVQADLVGQQAFSRDRPHPVPPRGELRDRFRPADGDDLGVRRDVRTVPVPAVHRRRHRRRARNPPHRGTDFLDVRREPLRRQPGRRPSHRPRARPPVVRQFGDRGTVARHLAARGIRLLRRMAVEPAVGRSQCRRMGTPLLREARCEPGAGAAGRPDPRARCSTTGSTNAVRSPCTPCG